MLNLLFSLLWIPTLLIPLVLAFLAFRLRQRTHEVEFLSLHLCALLRRNLPLADGVSTLAEEAALGLRRRLRRIARHLSEGRPLWKGLEAERGYFPASFLTVARAGEESGTLARLLGDFGRNIRAEAEFRTRLLGYLSYATLLLFYVGGAAGGVFTQVGPSISKVLSDLGVTGSLEVLEWAQAVIPVIWAGFALVGLALIHSELVQPRLARFALFRAPWDGLILLVPGLSDLTRCSSAARWARVLSALLTSGMPTAEAVETAGRAESHFFLRRRCLRAAAGVREGKTLGEAIRRARFPEPLPWTAAAAEGGGRMPLALEEAAGLLEARVFASLALAQRVLLPVFVLLLGAVVGLMCTSVFHALTTILHHSMW